MSQLHQIGCLFPCFFKDGSGILGARFAIGECPVPKEIVSQLYERERLSVPVYSKDGSLIFGARVATKMSSSKNFFL